MAKEELKVLAPFNLPLIGDDGNGVHHNAGGTVSVSQIEEYAEKAKEVMTDNERHGGEQAMTAKQYIDHFIEEGVLSWDMDADLHPDHQPVDPNAPSTARVVEMARQMVDVLGDDAPAELKAVADLDYTAIGVTEKGNGGDSGHVSS